MAKTDGGRVYAARHTFVMDDEDGNLVTVEEGQRVREDDPLFEHAPRHRFDLIEEGNEDG